MHLSNKDYVERIGAATRLGLLNITFELLLHHIDEAKKANDEVDFKTHIKNASAFMMELMTTLDMSYELSLDYMSLYIYANKLLLQAVRKFNQSRMVEKEIALEEAGKIVTSISESFSEFGKEFEELESSKFEELNVSEDAGYYQST